MTHVTDGTLPGPTGLIDDPEIEDLVLSPPSEHAGGIMPTLHLVTAMTQSCYQQVIAHLTTEPVEAAGMLVGPKRDNIITHFIPDFEARATATSITLGTKSLNQRLKEFVNCGLEAKGIAHSHPAGNIFPSTADIQYVAKLLRKPKNDDAVDFFLPIVCGSRLYPYIVFQACPDEVHCSHLVLL